jgi:iron complex outermembrane receptor protein
MNIYRPSRGVSACALVVALHSTAAFAQQSLPTINVGGARARQPGAHGGRPTAARPGATTQASNGGERGGQGGLVLQPPNAQIQLDAPAGSASRLGLTVRQTPGSISIVDRATIEARNAQTTKEALSRMPGVIAADPPGSAGSVSLRGFGPTSTVQLFNGIATYNDAITGRAVDSWLYDRVELLGGASSYLYGQGAVGGVVNYVSKIATRGQDRNEALLQGGMWFNRRASYGMNKQIDANNWAQFDVSYLGSDGWAENSHFNSGAGNASWLTDITPQLSNTVAVEFQHEERNANWGTPVPRPYVGAGTVPWTTVGLPVLTLRFDPGVRFKNYNADSPVFDQQVLWVRDIAEYKPSEALQFKNLFYFYRADRQYYNVEGYDYNAANTLLTRSASFATRHLHYVVGDRLEATNQTTIFGMDSKTVAGVEYSLVQQVRNPSFEPGTRAIDVVHPYYYSPIKKYEDNPFATGWIGGARNKLGVFALFAENRLSILPRLHLVTGARWETIALERFNFRPPTLPTLANPYGEPAYFSKDYQPFTWRAALMYDVTKDANVYVTYSTAADPASGTILTNNVSGVRNFDLTTGWQLEAGTKADFWDGKGSGTLAGYFIERKNLTTPDPLNPGSVIPVGQQSSNGIEANIGMQLLPTLNLQGNAAWINPKFDKFEETIAGRPISMAGRRPVNMARWIANGWITWDFMPDWQWMFAARFVGDRFADTRNAMRVPAYTTFDTIVSWQIHKNARLAASLKNIADANYIEWTTGRPLLFIGQPRTFEMSLKMSF